MAKDAELDRLKAAQNVAFQRKQDAYQAQESAWQCRLSAGNALSRAYENKQRTYTAQEATWQDYERISSRNDPEIDRLKALQETAFKNMKRAFDNASAAHDCRDGVAARSYADDGHRFKAESQGYVAERRRLVDENKAARARHDATKPAFQQAKNEFNSAKRTFDQAKIELERKQGRFKQAKDDFDRSSKAFKDRLHILKSQSQQKKSEKRAIAERAGVPYQYRDNVWISTDSGGKTNIYFGGVGDPNGLGHGHYVMDRSGKVTYKRDPFDPHGAQNFSEPQYWHKEKMSFDKDTQTYQTDNYIGITGSNGQKTKAHIAVNPLGEVTFVRDIGGEILYSRKDGIGHLPGDLDWSRQRFQ